MFILHDACQAISIWEGLQYGLLSRWRRSGLLVARPLNIGCPRELSVLDCAFLEGCIAHRPDIYLSELQEKLEDSRGVITSMSTIQQTILC
ncbi:hypothetical protein M407DRAFT_33525 [Tulasnella calospora MUT 4182]|uniref:Uncharacterized protein n=1 Tax=Tulasnella calospora MUT 4182 TaxID=1051891 RepID=A0A0C3L5S1_9AGAM|nr:hypothetical protein M407DRAFT_33525 [Tulasnella calospora MUT 4182]